mmetsp:Transcript_10790/g.25009  ORF Transcript_10790/g.25009 Transcript_10790/m.25009 type:complete len:183 (-) Transcript_10790:1158-1706(-)
MSFEDMSRHFNDGKQRVIPAPAMDEEEDSHSSCSSSDSHKPALGRSVMDSKLAQLFDCPLQNIGNNNKTNSNKAKNKTTGQTTTPTTTTTTTKNPYEDDVVRGRVADRRKWLLQEAFANSSNKKNEIATRGEEWDFKLPSSSSSTKPRRNSAVVMRRKEEWERRCAAHQTPKAGSAKGSLCL